MSKLKIRRHSPNDQEEIIALNVEALESAGAYAGPGPWNIDLNNVEEVYLQNGGEFLVGEIDGQIVAMGALLRINADEAKIRRMRVKPQFQRRGFGQAILDALEACAVEFGYKRLFLDTTPWQTASQRFYEKNGYQEYKRAAESKFTLIYYEKYL